MKRIIRLTESDLTRIVRQIIKENEEEWVDMSRDMEGESEFSKMDLENLEKFQILKSFFQENPDAVDEIKKAMKKEISSEISERFKYYDYGDSRGKKEITRNQYLKRKLMNYGIWGILGGIVGATMGQMSGEQVLEAAIIAASLGSVVGGELSASSGRERVRDEEPIDGEEPISERWSQKYKKSIDCNNPKGFSQKAHCQGRKKR